VLTPDVQQNVAGEWDEAAEVSGAIEKLTELKAAGIDTIVDPTVIGLGRYIPRIARIAAEVDLNILVATGVYTYDDVPSYFRIRGPAYGLPEPMVDLFVHDLTEGIGDTGIRAAFLKCAIDTPGLTPGVERVLRAVAAAHLATGAPVMVHTAAAERAGLVVHEVLASEGVDPRAVLLAHSGDSGDTDYLADLADRGYLLGMDRFGIDTYAPPEQRIAVVAELARRGYAERMVLAHDASCHIDWIDPVLRPALPNWHYLYISQQVLPALLEAGVTQDQIDTMLVANPKAWFDPNAEPYEVHL
jgi:phosphotriesterase-related protein